MGFPHIRTVHCKGKCSQEDTGTLEQTTSLRLTHGRGCSDGVPGNGCCFFSQRQEFVAFLLAWYTAWVCLCLYAFHRLSTPAPYFLAYFLMAFLSHHFLWTFFPTSASNLLAKVPVEIHTGKRRIHPANPCLGGVFLGHITSGGSQWIGQPVPGQATLRGAWGGGHMSQTMVTWLPLFAGLWMSHFSQDNQHHGQPVYDNGGGKWWETLVK